jgi:hypothetical protein
MFGSKRDNYLLIITIYRDPNRALLCLDAQLKKNATKSISKRLFIFFLIYKNKDFSEKIPSNNLFN